ncbi:HNH endonuclease, partial [Williamsia sp. MIQD14]
GQTCPGNTGSKCRFHHNLKTHTAFLDDQTTSRDGRTERVIVTPEGLTVDGPAFDGTDLFPALKDIRFTAPEHAPPTDTTAPGDTEPAPTRRRPRLADKHARRQAEREHNRRTRAAEQQAVREAEADDPPPF